MKYSTITVLLAALRIRRVRSEDADEFPNIEDLFPTESPELEPIKTVDFDIERIDLEKFKKKLEIYESEVLSNISSTEASSTKDARRQQIPNYDKWQWKRASTHLVKVKTLDLMLQTIYMARHRVRLVEREEHYNPQDTAYRVAFLYRKLRRLWRRIMDLYTTMIKYHRSIDMDSGMILHLRCIKLYEEFIYLWWVLVAVDGKYQSRLKTTVKKPFKRGKTSVMTIPRRERPVPT